MPRTPVPPDDSDEIISFPVDPENGSAAAGGRAGAAPDADSGPGTAEPDEADDDEPDDDDEDADDDDDEPDDDDDDEEEDAEDEEDEDEEAASVEDADAPTNELDAETVLFEAALDQLIADEDPWSYLDRIRESEIAVGGRMRYYNNFIAMVAQRPNAERDALLHSGAGVFHYRTETARRDVASIVVAGASALVVAPGVANADLIAEMIYVPDQMPDIKYMVHRFATGEREIADRVQIGSVLYTPPQSRLARMGALLLPTAATEYGTEADLIRDITAFIDEHVYLPNSRFRSIMAYYVMLTWVYDRFEVVPYLRFLGEPETGKSTGLDVVSTLAFRTVRTSGATTASPVFRILERFKGALSFDEADFDKSDLWADMVKILNVGYRRGFPVLRSERGSASERYEIEAFDVFGPKMLATRRSFEDLALESRCLTHTMVQVTVPASIPLVLGQEFRDAAQILRNKLLLWRFEHYWQAAFDPRTRIAGIGNRLNQILLPLLACSQSGDVRTEIIQHATSYQRSLRRDRSESFEGLVALHTLKRHCVSKVAGRVQLKEITESLKQEYGEDMRVDPKRVTDVVRKSFGFGTVTSVGTTWVEMTNADALWLSDTYGHPPESYDPKAQSGITREAAETGTDAAPRPRREAVPEPIVREAVPDEPVASALTSDNGAARPRREAAR